METVKIITYDQRYMTKDDSNTTPKSVQKLKDYWKSCWISEETQQLNGSKLPVFDQNLRNEKLKSKNYYKNSIAVIGLSCRFPKANNIDEFWETLITKSDGVGPYPPERAELLHLDYKSVSNHNCGFLSCPIEDFDADFFEISPREAELMDPQQRLLLEVAWEALENAAINPHSLNGGNTGVFTGIWRADYEKIVEKNIEHKIFPKIILGNSFSATSARLSYFLGCNGKNIVTESGCSSSLVALHLACGSLQCKEIDQAIVMGANLLIDTDMLDDDFVLAKDGHCKTFDEKADGYGRADGIAVIILKRLADAIGNGDRVMGIIRGNGISQEGTSSSFGTPSKRCQELAIKDALQNACVYPEDVDYVEAHGTGTPIGDTVEFEALSNCYSGCRSKPLVVGAVKTNIGHSESASGLAGLIKVILSLEKEIIPPNRNFNTLNPLINLKNIPAILPLQQQQWLRSLERVRIAGLSSFGISGTNVHIIVEEPPNVTEFEPFIINTLVADRTNHILTLSAKTHSALDDLVQLYTKYLSVSTEIDIRDLTFTANNGRAHFQHRLSVVGKDTAQLKERLQEKRNSLLLNEPLTIAFLFTGQGYQYNEMGNILYRSNAVFKNSFDKCVKMVNLKNILWNVDGKSQNLHNICSTISIFSIQYALFNLLLSLKIYPNLVLGHGIGEYAAAVVSGIIDLNDAITLLVKISLLTSEQPSSPTMAVFCSKDECSELIYTYTSQNPVEWLDIVAVNSFKEVVIAGEKESLLKFQEHSKSLNVSCEMLAETQFFHSRKVNEILNLYKETTSKIEFKEPHCQYVSGTTGLTLESGEMRNGNYWLRHARELVNFNQGMQTLFIHGCNVFIEIGPSPILLSLGKQIIDSKDLLWLPTLQQAKDDWEILLGSLGKLYNNNLDINWSSIETPDIRKKLTLPTYPFQREKFWISILEKKDKKIHPLLGKKVSLVSKQQRIYTNHLSLKDLPYLRNHQVANSVLIPGTVFLEIVLAAGKDSLLKNITNAKYTLNIKNFVIHAAFELKEKEQYETQVVAVKNGNECNSVDIDVYLKYNGWKKHASASVSLNEENSIESSFNKININDLKSQSNGNIKTDIYNEIEKLGFKFGATFRTALNSVWRQTKNEVLVSVRPKILFGNVNKYVYHSVTLYSMLQAMYLTMKIDNLDLRLPVSIENCFVYERICSEVSFVQAKWNEPMSNGAMALYNKENELLVVMMGVRCFRTTIKAFQCSIQRQESNLPGLYQEVWRLKLAPFEKRVNLQRTIVFKSCISDIEKELEYDMNSLDLSIYGTLKFYIHCRLQKLFIQNGINLGLGMVYSTQAIIKNKLLVLKYSNFLNRIIDTFVEDEFVVRLENRDSWKVVKQFPSLIDVEENIRKPERILKVTNLLNIDIWDKCLTQLWKIFAGKIDPMVALFGRSDINILDVYKIPFTRITNLRMAKFLSHNFNPSKFSEMANDKIGVVRIIEIGGGSATTSNEILRELQNTGIHYEYTFTDVSPQFFKPAKDLLSCFKDVDYKVLDIEKEPHMQGFCPHYFDIVVASNVIHATEDLRKSIKNARKLLVDGGWLLLQEILVPHIAMDVVYGALDGYWRFKDHDLRPYYPLVSKMTWDKVLNENHFESSHLLSELEVISSVLVAKAVSVNNKSTIRKHNHSFQERQKTWLILCDAAQMPTILVNKLTVLGDKVICLKNGDEESQNIASIDMLQEFKLENDLNLIMKSNNVCGIFYLILSDSDNENDELYIKTFNFCKYLAKKSIKNLKLLVATRGAVYIGNEKTVNPCSGAIWGMIKSLMFEVSNIATRLIDLDPDDLDGDLNGQELFYEIFETDERLICYRRGKKYVARFTEINEEMGTISLPKGRYVIKVPRSNIIKDLNIIPAKYCKLESNEVEIVVKAISLNFKDIILIIKPDNFYSPQEILGCDFAGIISSIGSKVTKFKIGEKVFGLKLGTAASHIIQKETDLIFHMPYKFSFSEAAIIPCCYLTAHYCLLVVAKLKISDTILIHSASGGVGLFAIQIAKYIGAQIIVTAGNNRKQAYLKSLGIKHVFNSRDLTFAENVNKVTNGRGVDIVLNSLTGPGFKETSLKICARGARFVEIGRLNIWKQKDIEKLRPDVVYTIFNLENISPTKIFDSLQKFWIEEIIKPIVYSRFHITKIREAISYFANANHIGKIVLFLPEDIGRKRMANLMHFNKNASYLITGGLGGIGLEIVKWMANSGAKSLVLVGRSLPNSKALGIITKMRQLGLHILTFQVDVGNKDQCKDFLHKIMSQLPPLKGVIHSAGVLSDATFSNQNWGKYQAVFNAKVKSCLNLHNLTKDLELEYFVLFSSILTKVKQIGQSNHSAANCFLDTFTNYRHSIGLPCQTINWGAWSEVGSAVASNFAGGANGMLPITPVQGIAALQFIMSRPDFIQLCVVNLSLNEFQNTTKPLKSYFQELLLEKNIHSSEYKYESEVFWQNLQSLSYKDRSTYIKLMLVDVVEKELKLSKGVNENRTFSELGFDSLMTIDLKNKISAILGDKMTIDNSTFLDYPTINTLSKFLIESSYMEKLDVDIDKTSTPTVLQSQDLEKLTNMVKLDSILPDDIKRTNKFVDTNNVKSIFLTGGTGNLGVYVILELLKKSQIKIVCLVRGSSVQLAYQRLVDNINKRNIFVDFDRIIVVNGDITKTRFGLNSQEYKNLSENMDVVYHLAAKINFFENYDQISPDGTDIRTVNVLGTLNVLKFAANIKTKCVFYASTVLTINKTTEQGNGYDEFPDEDNNGEDITMGYSLTKLVGEKLIRHAISRGIPCIVIRYPGLIGHSVTGYFNVGSDFAANIILMSLKLGVIFDDDGGLPVLPVDITAEITVELLFKDAYSDLYNLWIPTLLKFSDLANISDEIGYPLSTVTEDDFLFKLKQTNVGNSFVASFLNMFGLDFLKTFRDRNFIIKPLQKGQHQLLCKLSNKIILLLPNVSERLGTPKNTIKRCLAYADSSGVLKKLGIFPLRNKSCTNGCSKVAAIQ